MSELTTDNLHEKRMKKSQRRHERELSDIRFILKSVEGRRFYWGLMENCGSFQSGYCGDSTNGTNFNLGKKSVGLSLFNNLLEAKPDALAQMQQEHSAEDRADQLQDEIDIKNNGGLI